MRLERWMPGALRGVAVLMIFAVAVMTGCKGFFVPTCQEQNNCKTTTTPTPTPTPTLTLTPTPTPKAHTGTGIGMAASSEVYVANAMTGGIGAFRVISGQIQPIAGPVSTLASPPVAVAATPDGKWLFAATASGAILGYTIASDGTLQEGNSGQTFATVPHPVSMAVDPSGRLLFVASSDPTALHIFDIASTPGSGTQFVPAAQSTIALDAGTPVQTFLTPDERHLAVALGAGGVDVFALNADSGAVSGRVHLAPLHPTGKDMAIASDLSSRFLYVAESGAGIRALTVAADGNLSDLAGSPFGFDPEVWLSSVAVGPANGTLYAAYPTSSKIVAYGIGSDGALTAISATPYVPHGSATTLSLDAGGKYLLAVASDASSGLQAFAIDRGTPGTLAAVAKTPAEAAR